MDYTILLISDSYLKSSNCMYEVLEVMRDRNYRDKIFSAVIYSEIYYPITRAKYVKYWQDKFKELEDTLKEINVQNLGNLNEDLKRIQDISSNTAEFLDVVSYLNNPNVTDVCINIEEKLSQNCFLRNGKSQIGDDNDLFTTLGITKRKFNVEPTELEINQFVKNSFNQVVKLVSRLCQQYQEQNVWVQVQIEQIDTRTVIYQFYRNGKLAIGLKLFLSNMFGGGRENIGLSDNTMSLMNSQKTMTVEEVVADIWEHYIQIYLER